MMTEATTDDWYRKLKEEQKKEGDILDVEAILDGKPIYYYWSKEHRNE